jgi:hypothetical protein
MRVKKEFTGNRTRFLYSPWLLALLVSRVFFVDSTEKGRLRHAGKGAFFAAGAGKNTRDKNFLPCIVSRVVSSAA